MNYVKITMIVLVSFGVCNIQASAAAGTKSATGKVCSLRLPWAIVGGKAGSLRLPNAIEEAIGHKDLETVTEFFDTHPAYLEARDDLGRTPLMISLNLWDNDIFNALLQRGANVNAKDNQGRSILYELICRQDLNGIRTILNFNLFNQKELDINSKDGQGNTALHTLLASRGISPYYEEIMNLLLQHGAEANARNNEGKTPLWLIFRFDLSSQNKLKIAKTLLQYGADPFIPNAQGKTLLEHLEKKATQDPTENYAALAKFLREEFKEISKKAAEKMGEVLTGKEGGKEYILLELASIAAEYIVGQRQPAKKAPEVEKKSEGKQ